MAKTPMAKTGVRKGMPSTMLTRAEFARRLGERFHDPAFGPLQGEIGEITALTGNDAPSSKPPKLLNSVRHPG